MNSICSSMGCKAEAKFNYLTDEPTEVYLCDRHAHTSYVDTRYARVFLHNCSMSRCPVKLASRTKRIGWLCSAHDE